MTGEFGEAEIDQAVELANPVVEVLTQPVSMADKFAQALGRRIVQLRGRGTLLEGQPGKPRGIDRVGLGPLEARVLEAPSRERIEQGNVMPSGGQDREEVLPVMPRRLQDDQNRRRPQRFGKPRVPCLILGERDRATDRLACAVETGQHMPLGRDVDACKHDASLATIGRGASEPTPMLTLVQARTQAGKAWPQHAVRALNAGRGRQSHRRGQSLDHPAATLSQQPVLHLSRGSHR